jgi:hypothetical protein
LTDDLINRNALDFRFRAPDEAMSHEGISQVLQIVRGNEIPISHRGQNARGSQPHQPGARAGPERKLGMIPR